MAARCARAAAGNAGDRVSQSKCTERLPQRHCCVSRWLARNRFRRERKRCDRLSLGGGSPHRLPALAADLVRRQVAVIAATGGGPSAFAAKAATTTIPIVFNSADDPVKVGLVASLNRPGGNLTGVSRLSVELMPKRLELLREVIPSATAVAYLVDPNSSVATASSAQEAARTLGIELQVLRISADQDLEAVFARMVQAGVKALLVGSSSYFNSRST